MMPYPLWRIRAWVKHPRTSLAIWRKRRAFPEIGERITYHDEPTTVIAIDEYGDVQIADGNWVSWMHCCGKIRKE